MSKIGIEMQEIWVVVTDETYYPDVMYFSTEKKATRMYNSVINDCKPRFRHDEYLSSVFMSKVSNITIGEDINLDEYEA